MVFGGTVFSMEQRPREDIRERNQVAERGVRAADPGAPPRIDDDHDALPTDRSRGRPAFPDISPVSSQPGTCGHVGFRAVPDAVR
jgi:hypothetical protein